MSKNPVVYHTLEIFDMSKNIFQPARGIHFEYFDMSKLMACPLHYAKVMPAGFDMSKNTGLDGWRTCQKINSLSGSGFLTCQKFKVIGC